MILGPKAVMSPFDSQRGSGRSRVRQADPRLRPIYKGAGEAATRERVNGLDSRPTPRRWSGSTPLREDPCTEPAGEPAEDRGGLAIVPSCRRGPQGLRGGPRHRIRSHHFPRLMSKQLRPGFRLPQELASRLESRVQVKKLEGIDESRVNDST
jgi:hypothetical protein